MALGTGLHKDFFQKYHMQKDNQIRLLHYPPVEDKSLRAGKVERPGAHGDFGSMNLDKVGDSEVENPNEEGGVVPVPHSPEMIVVNIGHFMQRWSNDTLRSTMHRGREPLWDTDEGGSRFTWARYQYSIAYYIDADREKTVDCIPSCLGPTGQTSTSRSKAVSVLRCA
ncbi:uncharacterized protein LY79DRAFT_304715 [Colletotrichum navitas]|uniref:Isopenicillin N synthase-like Fe(2+) 2OG dioxygenase domain-containing protein n=1 Tax=Colletotrichum navitas TaxID=681940 RepID=A0AAD8PTP6_9PEZI|nr:uncharacterized protein LY79DRAFT_304715 [Colletotrichum navitas]KAK1580361.1 hypothetical protein LY79DRAFT_304715 [Colletotrichum navitas]